MSAVEGEKVNADGTESSPIKDIAGVENQQKLTCFFLPRSMAESGGFGVGKLKATEHARSEVQRHAARCVRRQP